MSGTVSLAVLHELFDYNYWARDRQLQACGALDQEQFLRPIGGSFPSVRETLAHLVAVEWIWLERWRGKSPRTLIPVEEFPTLAAVTERWSAVEREMRPYLAGLDEETLGRTFTYLSTRGEKWTYPLWRMIYHLLNHQSYHRGQVTTLLRMLGVEPPRIDFLVGQDVGFRLVG
ncbi:MAG: DinB family protein [Bryobacteraceae bacterium]